MPASSRASSWRSRIVLATGVVALGILHAAPAWGQEVEDDPAAENTPTDAFTLGLDDIGLGGSIPLYGTDGRVQLTVPVPVGSVPAALNAFMTIPAWLDRGWIDVEANDRPITRVVLASDAQTMPVSIPLTGVPVVDGAVTLDVSSTLISDVGYCPGDREDPVRFVDAVVDYTGTPAIPRTISEFLPPVLRKLTVFVPTEPVDDIVGAALTLTTSVIDYYDAQNVRVVVRPDTELLGADPDGPFDRSVVLAENNDAGSELIFAREQGPPRLFLFGSGNDLAAQTRLVTSAIAELAVTTKALAATPPPPPVLASDSMTLDALEIGTVTGAGTASIAIDQTRLGRSTSGVSVHLTGRYTPGPGSLTAAIDNTTLAVWPADDTGLLDQWIEIPNAELGRVTTLDVTIAHPSSGIAACGAQLDSTVTIDGTSVVESSGSESPAPLGFGSVPQALMPQVNVAMSENSLDNTMRAVSLLDGLQRMSTRTLMPQVVSLDAAFAGSDPAIVIVPDGDLPESIDLPLSSTGATTFNLAAIEDGDSEAALTLDTALPYGTVQVAETEAGAAMIVASSKAAPEQLDTLLGWLDADPERWFGLSGDVLFGAATVEPTSLSSANLAGAEADASVVAESNWLKAAAIAAAAVLFAVGIIAAVIIWLRSRGSAQRRHRRGDDPQAP